MNDFKHALKKRVTVLSICSVIAIIFVLVAGIWGYKTSINSDQHLADFTHGFATGLFAGFIAVVVFYIIKYIRAIKNEDKLKNLYIEENDEREALIKYKVSSTGFVFLFGCILILGTAASFINSIVCITLYGVLILMALVKIILRAYYNKKI